MMTDKTAHELLVTLDQWARDKISRGEGWAPGQYQSLVRFLDPPTPKHEPEVQRKETLSWPTKSSSTQK